MTERAKIAFPTMNGNSVELVTTSGINKTSKMPTLVEFNRPQLMSSLVEASFLSVII